MYIYKILEFSKMLDDILIEILQIITITIILDQEIDLIQIIIA